MSPNLEDFDVSVSGARVYRTGRPAGRITKAAPRRRAGGAGRPCGAYRSDRVPPAAAQALDNLALLARTRDALMADPLAHREELRQLLQDYRAFGFETNAAALHRRLLALGIVAS